MNGGVRVALDRAAYRARERDVIVGVVVLGLAGVALLVLARVLR